MRQGGGGAQEFSIRNALQEISQNTPFSRVLSAIFSCFIKEIPTKSRKLPNIDCISCTVFILFVKDL